MADQITAIFLEDEMKLGAVNSKFLVYAAAFGVLGFLYLNNVKDTGPRLILEQFIKIFQYGQIEKAEIFYCFQFTQTTARAWHDFEFHETAKPGAEEAGCRRKIVMFETNKESPNYIEVSKEQMATLDTLDGAIFFNIGDTNRDVAVAAAYFYQRSSHKVYALYFSDQQEINGIASMYFINNEWLMDQSYYVSVWNSTFGRKIFSKYITGQLDVPVK
jgi:hypothetical protein